MDGPLNLKRSLHQGGAKCANPSLGHFHASPTRTLRTTTLSIHPGATTGHSTRSKGPTNSHMMPAPGKPTGTSGESNKGFELLKRLRAKKHSRFAAFLKNVRFTPAKRTLSPPKTSQKEGSVLEAFCVSLRRNANCIAHSLPSPFSHLCDRYNSLLLHIPLASFKQQWQKQKCLFNCLKLGLCKPVQGKGMAIIAFSRCSREHKPTLSHEWFNLFCTFRRVLLQALGETKLVLP